MESKAQRYRTRLAPTPSGFLHLGHAATFLFTHKRCLEKKGVLIYRLEDIDRERTREEYIKSCEEDLSWLGISWHEGGVEPGGYGPYVQSENLTAYQKMWNALFEKGYLYPSPQSRKEIQALDLNKGFDGELVFPATLRDIDSNQFQRDQVNWRFKVPEGKVIRFYDQNLGKISFETGKDFGDFLVWRRNGWPSYELAVVHDDIQMKITEVIRGEDLLLSTARQILLYEALELTPPDWLHLPLLRNSEGEKLSKSKDSRSLKSMREEGVKVNEMIQLSEKHLEKVSI